MLHVRLHLNCNAVHATVFVWHCVYVPAKINTHKENAADCYHIFLKEVAYMYPEDCATAYQEKKLLQVLGIAFVGYPAVLLVNTEKLFQYLSVLMHT